MDPIATLFSLYLDTVTNSVHQHLTDTMGTELRAEVIHYQGFDIPFQYQMWKVRERSVCASHSDNMGRFSECTVKAKAMFSELCSELNKRPSDHWRLVKTRNMYCNAAVSFTPTIANISTSPTLSDVEAARRQCNLATAAALGSSDKNLAAERRRACEDYDNLRQETDSQ